jgi:RND family efflux transporter MFP subunit
MASTLRDELASLKIERHASNSTSGNRRSYGKGLASALIWLIPLAFLSGAGYYAYVQYERIRPRHEVSIGLVQKMTTGEAEKLLSAKGYIKSRHQAMIGARTPGRVEKMYVEEGTRVKKGDPIAVLEHNDLLATLASRKAQIQRTEAELLEAKYELREKERKASREGKLRSQSHSSVELVEQAEAARDMASARVTAMEAAYTLMKATAQETAETIRNAHIVAPFEGTVVAREAEVGETLTPGGMGGASGRGSVVTLADLDHLEVETDVAENLLSRVAIDQPAEIAVSAVPNKHYRGKLRQIIPMGDRTRGTVRVKVEILDPDQHLFPELVATVHFLPDKAVNNPIADKPAIYVPKAAILEQNGHSLVWVVDERMKLHQRRVEVVVTKDDLARVESGLEGGESVVLSPKPTLREKELVKVVE